MIRAIAVARDAAPAAETITLPYDERSVRRRRLTTDAGRDVLIDLPRTVGLDDGDALELDDGGRVTVRAAEEPLIEVRGDLARLAWHIGNRHCPCEVRADRLLIRSDHVLADMLSRLGADIAETRGPFKPEGGAYGHGHTMGHAHDHNGGHSHDHHHPHDA